MRVFFTAYLGSNSYAEPDQARQGKGAAQRIQAERKHLRERLPLMPSGLLSKAYFGRYFGRR